MTVNLKENPQGSIWHRWDPHIHVPGTILNNQYSDLDGGWEDFIKRVNNASPVIRALGITDYYSLASYRKVRELKSQGKFASIELIFPNIELRFDIGTASNTPINGHLLLSPEQDDHIEMAEQFLNRLSDNAHGSKFTCNRSELIRLGRIHRNNNTLEEAAALEVGTNQFKVNFQQLIQELKDDKWAHENILLAIATNTGDGTSGLNNDASFDSTRKHMERNAQIIFGSSEKNRNFWLGLGVLTKQEIEASYQSCKPCIHGSDAHKNEDVAKVAGNRFTWIKGDLTFESLRQICIEPTGRVFVGEAPLSSNVASRTIESLEVSNADWMIPAKHRINPGFTAIIGARGSGKTALADFIAAGGYASSDQFENSSFIVRAQDYLQEVNLALHWTVGSSTSRRIDQIGNFFESEPRIQYLSQKFVDSLCSAEDGLSQGLLKEIERVIFNSHPESSRLGMSDFREMLDFRASNARESRLDAERLLMDLSTILTTERNKKNSIEQLTKRIDEKNKLIEADKKSRGSLLKPGQEQRVQTLHQIEAALETVTKKLDNANRQSQALQNLKNSVATARSTGFPNYLSRLKQNHSDTNFDENKWQKFKVDFVGEVDSLLDEEIKQTNISVRAITGSTSIDHNINVNTPPFFQNYSDLNNTPFNLLKNEAKRLELLISVDTSNAQHYSRLTSKISKDEGEVDKIKRELQDAQGAPERIQQLLLQKKTAYKDVFNSILEEENELKKLYEPLMCNLSGNVGSLRKLSFVVKRTADVVSWAKMGEDLLDLRKQGNFKGKGALLACIESELKTIWEEGTAEAISQAITDFRNKHESTILAHSLFERTEQPAFNQWATKIADWIYSTNHISVKYGIQYDGVAIQQLSPGTRGIVLLLLYLAIDKEDDRTLIIDQPEENLDPKSIYQELVPLFMSAKKRRQIIIVTHNANLVVNTDADQVIVAKGGDHRPGQLPEIRYASGGLENPLIRNEVCEILEGGEEAFRERAKRLRVAFL